MQSWQEANRTLVRFIFRFVGRLVGIDSFHFIHDLCFWSRNTIIHIPTITMSIHTYQEIICRRILSTQNLVSWHKKCLHTNFIACRFSVGVDKILQTFTNEIQPWQISFGYFRIYRPIWIARFGPTRWRRDCQLLVDQYPVLCRLAKSQ